MSRCTPARADELRGSMQELVRSFGALASERTPCGQPIAIAHAHALMILRARGELSQQQLGAELGIDKSNVARLCAKMVEAGHAVQRVGEHDARSRLVSLTARGSRVADGVDASSRARFLAILQQIAPERREAVLEALADLVSAVRALSVARAEEEAA